MAGLGAEDDTAYVAGDGDYAFEVVCGSRHQEALEWLAQGRGEEPVECACTAVLAREPDNPFDPNAVSVSIQGVRVGYLPPDTATAITAAMQLWGYDRATCEALIEGGWYRSAEDKGDFTVRLDMNPDFVPNPNFLPDTDFVSTGVPAFDPPLVQLPAAAAAASKRKTLYDLGLGAIATVVMLALIGVVWLFLQPSTTFVTSDGHPASSPETMPVREAGLAASESIRLPVEAVEQAGAAATTARPKKVDAMTPVARGGIAVREAAPEVEATPVVAARRAQTIADTPVDRKRSIMAMPAVNATEVAPDSGGTRASPVRAAEEVLPRTASMTPPPTLRPVTHSVSLVALADGLADPRTPVIVGQPINIVPPPRPVVEGEDDPKATPNSTRADTTVASRSSSRAARSHVRSRRSSQRYSRQRRRTAAQEQQRPAATTQQGSTSPAFPATPAARMFQAWTKEWSGALERPRPTR